ncbi:hypothetical protein HCB17_23920 [Salinispora arenicola]|nr:hypothetical protein [Salinispora arenicola]
MGAAPPAESFTDVITVELAKLNSDRPALTLLRGCRSCPLSCQRCRSSLRGSCRGRLTVRGCPTQ